MNQVLSFEITPIVKNADAGAAPTPDSINFGSPGAFLHVTVEALVDGRSLYDGEPDVFDAVRVLAQSTHPDTLDIYTCSCGNAGCAGIWEDTNLVVGKDFVSWVFPESDFRSRFGDEVFPAGTPMTVTFTKSQYVEALKELQDNIEALRVQHNLPFAVGPNPGYPKWSKGVSFHKSVAKARKRRLEYRARVKADAAAEGNIADWEIHAQMPDGALRIAGVARLAWDSLPDYRMSDRQQREFFIKKARPLWEADPLGMLKTIPPSRLNYPFYVSSAPEGYEEPEDWTTQWPQAVISLVREPLETPNTPSCFFVTR